MHTHTRWWSDGGMKVGKGFMYSWLERKQHRKHNKCKSCLTVISLPLSLWNQSRSRWRPGGGQATVRQIVRKSRIDVPHSCDWSCVRTGTDSECLSPPGSTFVVNSYRVWNEFIPMCVAPSFFVLFVCVPFPRTISDQWGEKRRGAETGRWLEYVVD